MRLIDADKLMERFRIVAQSGGPVVVHVSDICATIEDEACEESVDAVEVVRCKDCKLAFVNPFIADYPQLVCRKGINWRAVEPNEFCSHGERKDNG
jgi:hypothetical protein